MRTLTDTLLGAAPFLPVLLAMYVAMPNEVGLCGRVLVRVVSLGAVSL